MDNCRIVSNEERLLIDFYQFVGPVNSKRTAAIIFDWTTGNILLVSSMLSLHSLLLIIELLSAIHQDAGHCFSHQRPDYPTP